jgi:hypothetical protein
MLPESAQPRGQGGAGEERRRAEKRNDARILTDAACRTHATRMTTSSVNGPCDATPPPAEHDDRGITSALLIAVEPVLVGAPDAARMCGLSERYWRKLDRTGRTPAAVCVGRRRLWAVENLRAWSAAGCPPRGDV